MTRPIKFRAYSTINKPRMIEWDELSGTSTDCLRESSEWKVMQFTGLHDRNGVEIYEGDILEFSDKWEWYRGEWWGKLAFSRGDNREKLKAQYESLPMERRVVVYDINEGYNFSTGDLQIWEIIGNIHETPELLEDE